MGLLVLCWYCSDCYVIRVLDVDWLDCSHVLLSMFKQRKSKLKFALFFGWGYVNLSRHESLKGKILKHPQGKKIQIFNTQFHMHLSLLISVAFFTVWTIYFTKKMPPRLNWLLWIEIFLQTWWQSVMITAFLFFLQRTVLSSLVIWSC